MLLSLSPPQPPKNSTKILETHIESRWLWCIKSPTLCCKNMARAASSIKSSFAMFNVFFITDTNDCQVVVCRRSIAKKRRLSWDFQRRSRKVWIRSFYEASEKKRKIINISFSVFHWLPNLKVENRFSFRKSWNFKEKVKKVEPKKSWLIKIMQLKLQSN